MAKQKQAAQKPDYRVDATIPREDPKTGERKTYWRVYYWAERPDTQHRAEDDKFHWHPDSEHATEEAAKKRMAELKAGAKRQSILTPHNMTKH